MANKTVEKKNEEVVESVEVAETATEATPQGNKVAKFFKKIGLAMGNFFKRTGKNIGNGCKDKAVSFKEWCKNTKESTIQWGKRIKNRSFKENMKELGRFFYSQRGWLWLIPTLILLIIFTFYPIIQTVIYSFQEGYDKLGSMGGKAYSGVGFKNYSDVFKYGNFKYCLQNTLLFSFISVPLSTVLALLISVGLHSMKWLKKAYQTIFFLPYLTNALSVGAVFATMFQVIQLGGGSDNVQTYGLVNNLFHTKIDWLTTTTDNIWHNRLVVIVYEVWAGLPFKILILFGALQNVNKQYYDAAKIDGASKYTTLMKITVPLISPMISYLIITGFIGGFKAYTAIVGIFGKPDGKPINTVVGFIYELIDLSMYGLAAAGALILFGIILVFTLINLQISKKKVHY